MVQRSQNGTSPHENTGSEEVKGHWLVRSCSACVKTIQIRVFQDGSARIWTGNLRDLWLWATCTSVPPTVDDQKVLETYWCLCCTYTCTSLTPPLQNEEAGSDPCTARSWLTFTAGHEPFSLTLLTKNKQTLYCVSASLSALFTISVNSKPQICTEITDSVVS